MYTMTIRFNSDTIYLNSPDESLLNLLDDASHIVEFYHEFVDRVPEEAHISFLHRTEIVFSTLFNFALNNEVAAREVIPDLVKSALILELTNPNVSIQYKLTP